MWRACRDRRHRNRGTPSGAKVWTISSFGITSWNEPWTLPSISGPDIVMR